MTKIAPYVQSNFRWNFSVNLIDITFITLAMSLISRETIMPLLVSELTDSKIAIGLIPAIFSITFYLPQLFAASYTEGLKRKLPFVMLIGGLVERVPYLLIGLAILLLAQDQPELALLAFFFFIGLGSFGAGVATPAWFTMIGKVIPVQRRGIFFGVSEGLGTLMGIIGASFVATTLDQVDYPQNFATLFIAAAFFMGISWLGLSLNREPESAIVKQQIPMRHYFQQLPAILRNYHNYRRFLIGYSLNRLGMMSVGFFIIFANDRFELSGAEVGLLTALLIGSQAATQLFLGWLGDRRGHKLNLMISGFAVVLAALVAIISSSLLGLMPAFVLLGIAIASDNISRFNIVLEFAVPQDQPTFIGLTNTLLAPITFLAPIFGGWVAGYDFPLLFILSALSALIGGLLLAFWVTEPRQSQPQPIAAD